MIKMPLVKVGNEYVRRLHPLDCQITKTLQPLSTVDMTVPPMDEVEVLDWVKIESPDGTVEYYRVSNVTIDAVTGNKSVSLEHGACTLDDIIIPESTGRESYAVSGDVRTVLSTLVSSVSRWTIGTVEDTERVYIEPGGSSVMTAILTMMSSIPDYQLEFVQESESNWHIDIIHRPTEPICECRLSRNLKTCDITYTKDGICTRVCSDQLPNGYLDSENMSIYGLFEHDVSINENLDDDQKMRVATAYLAAHDHPAISISISGLELSQITGLPIDSFKLGTVCRIAIPWLGIVRDEVIVDKTYNAPYNTPEDVSFTLANATPDLSLTVASVTGGGGGGGGIGSAGLGGQAAELKKYATKFDQTDQYLSLIATETEWDELGNGTVTAYGKLTLTSTKFETVVSAIGADGTITAASIVAAINGDTSEITLSADKIDIDGVVTSLKSKNIECGKLKTEGEIHTLNHIYAEDYIHTDEYLSCAKYVKVGSHKATWQVVEVITGLNITMPSISRRSSGYWVYANNGDTTDLHTASGQIITSYTAGSVDAPTTKILYYLGRLDING